jgi:putative endonuclease
MHFVYILYSLGYDKIYVGYTTNIVERVKSHNELGKKGWTLQYRPWELIHIESFATKQEALNREKKLKAGKGREWIWNELIPSKRSSG